MYDALLFLHVLAAFALIAAMVMYTGFTLGATPSQGSFTLATRLEDVGGLGTLIFGIWLALDVDGYGLLDFWIIAALVLWAAAGGAGGQYRGAVFPAFEPGGNVAAALQKAAVLNWVRVALAILLLADMIWKPWA